MKQITTRLYIANTISDEQLNRLSPNVVVVLDSGNNEEKLYTFCLNKGFISKMHNISKPLDSDIEKYASMSSLIFSTGDKFLIISNDSRTMHNYASKLLMLSTGMLKEDAAEFVRNKIGKT